MSRPIGKETIPVYDNAIAVLTPPSGARLAMVICEPDASTADKLKAVRYWTTGDEPTASEGLHLGTGPIACRWLHRHAEIDGFKAIGVEAGRIHFLQVEYYR